MSDRLTLPMWRCKTCGCLWRDNLDGFVSLFDATQKSCAECERSTPEACEIAWETFVRVADLARAEQRRRRRP